MSDLIKRVTPLTTGIIWLVQDETNAAHSNYSDIDYLLDGLLTANFKGFEGVSSRVIVGQNFNKPFYVLVLKEVRNIEIESFVTLVKKNLLPENDIIVINQSGEFDKLRPLLKDIQNHLHS